MKPEEQYEEINMDTNSIVQKILGLYDYKVVDLNNEGSFLNRELLLVKVKAKGERRVESLRVADIFRARVIDSSNQSLVFELTGSADKLDAFIKLMQSSKLFTLDLFLPTISTAVP